jgi:hypothetical protein|eukprot:SAG25_NODE_24_length_22161_cov_23.692405_6_plen_432_part_00
MLRRRTAHGSASDTPAPAAPVLEAAHPAHCQRNTVSLFWEEKIYIGVDFAQQFALMRLLAQGWAWPPFWRRWTRWTLLFLLDIPAYLHRDADDYRHDQEGTGTGAGAARIKTDWSLYFSCWVGGVGVLLACAIVARLVLEPMHRRHRCYCAVIRLCIALGEILYFPALVAVPRLYGCAAAPRMGSGNNPFTDNLGQAMFSNQPQCGGAVHILACGGATLVFLTLLVGLPLLLWLVPRQQVIYNEDVAHEMFLRSRELESLLGINELWRTSHFHCFSSFRRRCAFHKAVVCLQRAVLASTVVMPPVAQTSVILAILSAGELSALVRPCYRCLSSGTISAALGWTSVCNAGSGWLKAIGVRSFFLVDSNLQYALIGMNGVGVGCALVVPTFEALFACGQPHRQHLSQPQQVSQPSTVGWPITPADAVRLCAAV